MSGNKECIKQTPKICILGAGFAGLTVALQLRRLLNWNTFTIYEKNEDIGGAWFSNTYPGAACDFPGHAYSWSFEQNPDWTASFPPQSEILDYMKKVVKKYNIYKYMELKTEVKSVIWNELTSKWNVVTKNKETGITKNQTFDFVFSGLNFLWKPNKPKIFENFTGPCFHSAEWDHSIDLTEKVVGVIGNGASAVQLIPEIANQVKILHSFQRHPSWVLPKHTYVYSTWIRWAFRNIPLVMKLHRWYFFFKISLTHAALFSGSWLNKFGKSNFTIKDVESIEDKNVDELSEV